MQNNDSVNQTELTSKERRRQHRLERRRKRNARIARFRTFKNFIWFLMGVVFLPVIIAASAFIVPIGVITGYDGENVSTEFSGKSLGEVALTLMKNGTSEYGFADFPFIVKQVDNALEMEVLRPGLKLGDLIHIDSEKLENVTFNLSDIGTQLYECIDIVATLKSAGIIEMMGTYGTLSVLTEYAAAGQLSDFTDYDETDGYTLKADLNAKEYYYAVSADVYARAFDDDGKPIQTIADMADAAGEIALFYPALQDVKIMELIEIAGNAVSRIKIAEILDFVNVTDEDILEIVGDMTIADINDIGKIVKDVKVKTILSALDASGLDNVIDIICSAVAVEEGETPPTADTLTVGDIMQGLSIEQIKVSAIAPDLDDDIYNILCSAVILEEGEDKPTKDTLTVGHLMGGMDILQIPLDTVLDLDEEDMLYKVLHAAVTGTGEDGAILIRDLTTGFNLNGVLLKDVAPDLDDDIYNILCNAVTLEEGQDKPTKNTLTIGHLISGMDITQIPLDTVLDLDEEDMLYKVLHAAVTGTGEDGAILIRDLTTGFNVEKVPLDTVLELDEEDTLYKILHAAVTGTGEDGEILIGDLTSELNLDNVKLIDVAPELDNEMFDLLCSIVVVGEGEDQPTKNTLTIGHLKNIDTNVDTILDLDENDTLYKVLHAAVTDANEDGKISISELADDFDITRITLGLVLEEDPEDEDSVTFWKVLRQATGTADGEDIPISALTSMHLNDIELKTVVKYDEENEANQKMWDILEQAITHEGEGEITLHDLNYNFNINNVSLDSVLTLDEEDMLYKVLHTAVTDANEDGEISIDELSTGFDIEKLTLGLVLEEDPEDENSVMFWKILRQATGTAAGADIPLGALATMHLENIELKSVIKYDEESAANQKLWAILEEAITHVGEGDEITLDDLNYRFSIDNVKLESVMERTTGNAQLWAILDDAVTASNEDGYIRISDLSSGFNVNDIALETVLTRITDPTDGNYANNHRLWQILDSGITNINEDGVLSIGEFVSGFEVNNVPLTDIIENTPSDAANQKLWEIINAAIEDANDDGIITLYDLNYGFSVDNIPIDSIITNPGDNKILNAITGKDYTVSQIGTAINNIDVSDIFDNTDCFTMVAGEAADTDAKYVYDANTKTYTLDAGGDHYISAGAKIWLFIRYETDGTYSADSATKGSANVYTEKAVTFSDLGNAMSGMTDTLVNAKIRQLVQAGIIANGYSAIYNQTIIDILNAAS